MTQMWVMKGREGLRDVGLGRYTLLLMFIQVVQAVIAVCEK